MQTETALITGASSGIGLEIANQLAASGSDLVLSARRRDRLESIAGRLRAETGRKIVIIDEDLADPAGPARICARLEAEQIDVDLLVNNAGFGARGTVLDLDLERQLNMIQLNITALTDLTRRLLPAMVKRQRGGVLNVASTAAFQPGPNMSVYYATKAYVLSFSEGLAEELRGQGVQATCLAPGATATEFAAGADMEDSLLFRMGAMSAERVARAGIRGFRAGKVLVVPGLSNRIGAASVRFAPRALVRKLVKRIQA